MIKTNLKIFDHTWHQWDQFFKPIPYHMKHQEIFDFLSVCNGEICVNSLDLAKYLEMPAKKLHNILANHTYIKQTKIIEGQAYMSKNKTQYAQWLMADQIYLLNHFKDILNVYKTMWHYFYIRFSDASDYIENHTWCKTKLNTAITGIGNLHALLNIIMGVEMTFKPSAHQLIKLDTSNVIFENQHYNLNDFDLNKINQYKSANYNNHTTLLFRHRMMPPHVR